jgi:epoxyqueuosine reductase QueG
MKNQKKTGPDHPDGPSAWLDLAELADLSSRGLKRKLNETAMDRLSRSRLKRNIAVILGNSNPTASPIDVRLDLLKRLINDPSDLVRVHADKAIKRIQTTTTS